MDKPKTNKHWVTNPKQCTEMERRNGWKLLRTRTDKNARDLLNTECTFEGEQTSFTDDRADD